jgi:N-methylhydantoinase B/oxoprolinase/acetone carboxylase alpha subunit
MKFTRLLNIALLAQQILAHPGQSAEEHAKEVAERRAYLSANKRSLDHCAAALTKRGNAIAMHQRRAAHIEKLRAKTATNTGEFPACTERGEAYETERYVQSSNPRSRKCH